MLTMSLAHFGIVDINQSCDLKQPFSMRTPFCLSGKAMSLPLLRSTTKVVLRALARCLSRKRDRTSTVIGVFEADVGGVHMPSRSQLAIQQIADLVGTEITGIGGGHLCEKAQRAFGILD